MKVLIIPDVHLKPQIVYAASRMMKTGKIDQAVCLMDIADDFNKEKDVELYIRTYESVITFAHEYPGTLFCWGNHECSYQWQLEQSGYSKYVAPTVQYELRKLCKTTNNLAYIHRIDNVLFMHGGLPDYFVQNYVSDYHADIDKIITEINSFGMQEMWNNYSPIWFRPQLNKMPLFRENEFLQVVGHTPVSEISKRGNLLSTDTFSTREVGRPIENQKFAIVDTILGEHFEIGLNDLE